MKIKAYLPLIACLFLFVACTSTKSCKNMIGTYRVIPFAEPQGLTLLATELISTSPIGTPIFTVQNKNNKMQHIGLIHKNIFPITLTPLNKEAQTHTLVDALFRSKFPVPTCFYELGQGKLVVQVDLTKLSEQKLKQGLNDIRRTWGSDFPDIEQDHQKLIQNNYDIQYYKMDAQSLRKVKYFFISAYSEVGVGGMAFFIPLQKTTDTTQFTPIKSPLIKR